MEERAINTSEDDEQLVGISRALLKWIICPESKERITVMTDAEVVLQIFRGAVITQVLPALQQALKMNMIPREGVVEIFTFVKSLPGAKKMLEESDRKAADVIFSTLDQMGIQIEDQ